MLSLYDVEKGDIKAYFINDNSDTNDEILNTDPYTYENIDTINFFDAHLIDSIIFHSSETASFIFKQSEFKVALDFFYKRMEVNFKQDSVEGTYVNASLGTGIEVSIRRKKISIKEIKKGLQVNCYGNIGATVKFYNFKLKYNKTL
ncbi:MAG: hypothetical protein B6I20_14540 [Bacteroidetes bacterium 4572_117]|nr:MAG: hypothetical protein B6I20_14540 [Bacteroidetes bacterium 4572_117]